MGSKALSYTYTIDGDKEISDVRLKKRYCIVLKKTGALADFSSAKAPLSSNRIFLSPQYMRDSYANTKILRPKILKLENLE